MPSSTFPSSHTLPFSSLPRPHLPQPHLRQNPSPAFQMAFQAWQEVSPIPFKEPCPCSQVSDGLSRGLTRQRGVRVLQVGQRHQEEAKVRTRHWIRKMAKEEQGPLALAKAYRSLPSSKPSRTPKPVVPNPRHHRPSLVRLNPRVSSQVNRTINLVIESPPRLAMAEGRRTISSLLMHANCWIRRSRIIGLDRQK